MPYDNAFGSLMGACIGDAAGAHLEFLGRKPSSEEVLRALALPGGGVFELAPGQITDDGELTLCLARGLVAGNEFNLELIASEYAMWIASQPFDVGNTTRQSLGCIGVPQWRSVASQFGYAEAMTRAARYSCMGSKANGSLMRATPIGIWAHRKPDEEIARYAIQDSSLSHSNDSCCHAVACYCIAVANLVRTKGNRGAAWEAAHNWAGNFANQEVRNWLDDAANKRLPAFYPLAGFIRIAFTHAFYHLQAGTGFIEALSDTLAGGGDTDTNACIVGGLIGAATGAESIPKEMVAIVLGCDTLLGKNPRPAFLSTSSIPALVSSLLKWSEAQPTT